VKIAIHQPNFLPWIGYFNKINHADTFVFLDDVQFERGKTFTSRTKIIASRSEYWLTVPVLGKSELSPIKDIKVDCPKIWKRKHLKTLELNYKKHPHFESVYELICNAYQHDFDYLKEYNILLIKSICQFLNIETSFINASDLVHGNNLKGWAKIISILQELEADEYLSGAGAGSKRYIDETDLSNKNIRISWQNFQIIPYPQFEVQNFISHLSIIDLLFNHGKASISFIQ
jgi:hypothetical protein